MGSLGELVALSRRYGSDPAWVLAGGGNTSVKLGRRLHVKASGFPLSDIGEEGFCEMDRDRLDAVWSARYPEDAAAREKAALADLMAARVPGEAKRPSVETLMHGLFPQDYVVHTHPALVNGLSCSRGGEAAFARLFGDEGIWVPCVDPGYVLAKSVRAAVEAFRARAGRWPAIMVMQNHGLLVAADGPDGIDELSRSVVGRIKAEVRREPDLSALPADASAVAAAAPELLGLAAGAAQRAESAAGAAPGAAPAAARIRFRSDAETAARSSAAERFAAISSAFTPDHIVYAGHAFLLAGEGADGIGRAWRDFVRREGAAPRSVVVPGLGAFALGPSDKAADAAIALYADALKVAAYAESFGGALHMAKERIDFIRSWEVETYRAKVNAGS